MIGVGWLTGMKGWLGDAGPAGAILAFASGGTLMLAIGFCYAKVMAILPVSGGEVAYAYKAFGTGESFLIGWFLTFGYLSVSAFEAVSIGIVGSYLAPFDHWPLYEIGDSKVYLSHLVLAHLSEENNCPDKAAAEVAKGLNGSDTALYVAGPDRPGEMIRL